MPTAILEPAPSAIPAHPPQGKWTYEDYLKLPDDGRRYEIIEGVLYVSNAPSAAHQIAVFEIAKAIDALVVEKALGQKITAPFEVKLSETTRPVQPDILFVRADRWPGASVTSFDGAPDLIVEVLSPSSVRTDRHIKFGAYELAGVSEYWIADPVLKVIEVYNLENGEYSPPAVYIQEQPVQSKVLVGFSVPCNRLFAK